MKKFTLFAIAALISVVAFAQKPNSFLKANTIPFEQTQIKAKAVSRQATVRKAPRRSLGLVTPPESAVAETYFTTSGKLLVYGSSGWQNVTPESIQVIVDGTDIYIAGLAYYVEEAWIKGTIDGSTATFPAAQQVDDDEQYPEWISGSDDGETICDIVFNFDQEAGTLECLTTYIGECAVEDAFNIYAYWQQPSFSKEQPAGPEVVVAPENLVTEEYAVSARNYKDDADVSGVWQIGFDGNDVYVQGMCSRIPEAWVKGKLEGTTITFAKGQYFGNYAGSYDIFLNSLLDADVVFDYDAETGTLTAQNEVFLTDNDDYYFDSYRNAVIKKVVEQAAMPANPAITSLTNGQYGWYFNFNVPNVDVDGNGLLSSKLSYIIYTDIEGEIAPLTFTPDTHTRLTEEMTEIPYGFTEDWDFYDTQIYLNELYSSDWNNIGIQSIYRGGGEENATEIQWYHIKDYVITEFTFNFNEMDVPTSTNVTHDGDINEDLTITEGLVSLTISPQYGGFTTPNRFWSTTAGPQLRVYSNTLTFEVPDGYVITEIVFNHNGNWGANTVDGDKIPNDADAKVATWTGEAQNVVVTIGSLNTETGKWSSGNSQINSINVTISALKEELVELPDGVQAEAWALEGFYSDGSDGFDVFRATEVAFDGTDIYVKGLPYWFEDSWLKGTIDAGIATFPAGQFVGEDEYGQEFMIGFDGADFCDIQYVYDADAKTLTQATPYVIESSTKSGLDEEGELAFWGFWEVSYLHAGAPAVVEEVEVPEGLVTDTYIFTANEWVEESDGDGARRLKAPRKAMVLEPYSKQLQVGFDGNDVYFKGLTDNTADMWAKGTLSGDGKTVTIPASQYLGFLSTWGFVFDYYLTAVDESGELEDIVFNYDADTNTFSTDQTIMLNGSMFVYYPYQTFTDVQITKIPEFAATPADPSIEGYQLEGVSYPYIEFVIPTQDVDGNQILASMLFYTVWIEQGGVEQPFVVLADEYRYVEEDWTEVPYDWDDSYDIYKGGSKFYINPTDVIPSWTKFGIQSIYYGGGECNKSNIVWMDNPVYDPTTAITDVNFNNQKVVVFDLQGRRVADPAKGLYIVNGKKVVLK